MADTTGWKTAWRRNLNNPSHVGSPQAATALMKATPRYQLWQKQREARNANLRRYHNILQGYQQRYRNLEGMLEGAGQQRRRDIQTAGASAQAAVEQSLVSRGMGGTTIVPTMKAGIRRRTQANLNRLAEMMAQNRAQVLGQASKDTLRFQERRTDSYPNLAGYYQMMQQAGRYS
jgi:hypothetical protein